MGQLQREYFERLGQSLTARVRSGCEGKLAYSVSGAEKVLRALRKRHAGNYGGYRSHQKVSTYRCFTCGHWHIGSKLDNPAGATMSRIRKSFTPATI